MKKNYVCPAISGVALNPRDIITSSSILDSLEQIIAGSDKRDPSMEDDIDG